MAAHDATTLRFYAEQAATYASRPGAGMAPQLDAFLSALPPGASILELGCGGGQDSAAMLARGFDVWPTDGTPEIAREAEKRLGRPVAVLRFDELADRDRYDGVWANACLLHVPATDLADVLGRIRGALKTGGLFYASFKAGDGEGRDRFGRYYNYPSAESLRAVYAKAGWAEIHIEEEAGSGYDGEPTQWLSVKAVKGA